MQILLSERRICNFCKSDNSRLAQVWVCLCVQIGKKYITSLCKANMSHQRRPFFLQFISVMLFWRWFTLSICQMGLSLTIFPGKSNHHSMQCYITAKIRLSKRQYNLFRGKRRPWSIASGQTCRNILLLQSRQWLWRLCRCPHLPEYADCWSVPRASCAVDWGLQIKSASMETLTAVTILIFHYTSVAEHAK